MEAIIRTEKLTRQFGGLVAVNQVDFKITKGEIRGLIGPNGSGKTTLINLLTGVYEPSAGRIFLIIRISLPGPLIALPKKD